MGTGIKSPMTSTAVPCTCVPWVQRTGDGVCQDRVVSLAEDLSDWTDADIAERALGDVLGVFAGHPPGQVKALLWTDNPLGNALWEMLHTLVKAGVLEYRDTDQDHQFRWSVTGPVEVGGRVDDGV
jgi:hypothetical protein